MKALGGVLVILGGIGLFLAWSLWALGWPKIGFEGAAVVGGLAGIVGPTSVLIGVLVFIIGHFSKAKP